MINIKNCGHSQQNSHFFQHFLAMLIFNRYLFSSCCVLIELITRLGKIKVKKTKAKNTQNFYVLNKDVLTMSTMTQVKEIYTPSVGGSHPHTTSSHT